MQMNTPQNKKMTNDIVHANSNAANKKNCFDMEKEYRCPVCKRLLMKGKIIRIETRCPKCKKICIIRDQ